jgi:hypothetical protein
MVWQLLFQTLENFPGDAAPSFYFAFSAAVT